MEKLSFDTPLYFGKQPASFLQDVSQALDSYLHCSCGPTREVAHVVDAGKVILAWHNFPKKPFYITLLKIVSYATIIIPLIAVAIKAVLRQWIYNFEVINRRDFGEKLLAQGLEIPEGVAPALEQSIHALLTYRPRLNPHFEHPEIELLKPFNYGINTFKLKGFPGLVFRVDCSDPEVLWKDGFNQMVESKLACSIHSFDRLVIPPTATMTIKGKTILVTQDMHEGVPLVELPLTQALSPAFVEATRQMAHLTIEANLGETRLCALRALDGGRIARLCFHTLGSEDGLFGRKGLVAHLRSNNQVLAVIQEAASNGIVSQIRDRITEYWDDLGRYYRDKTPTQPIPMPSLSPAEQLEICERSHATMQQVVSDTIQYLDQTIALQQKQRPRDTIVESRSVQLHTNLRLYSKYFLSIDRALEILKNKGSIFDYEILVNSIWVQA